jgi:hypothetical protein
MYRRSRGVERARNTTGGTIPVLGIASTMSQPAAQALSPDEAHDAPARVRPNVTLSPAQKRTIYNCPGNNNGQQNIRLSPTTSQNGQ